MNTPNTIPQVIFKTHTYDPQVCGIEPFAWVDVSSDEIFSDKKVIVFSLPGAFTPTCSATHLPGYESHYNEFKALGIDAIICISVNDAFVMKHWGLDQGVKNVQLLPDGSGVFTKAMDMLVKKDNLGFGERSWRYSMLVDNGSIEKMFIEPGKEDNCATDPFEVSDADTMLAYLKNQ
jgi:peroxiredoxin